MEWIYNNPVRPGKYIVTTITDFKNTHVLEAIWNGKRWNFSNQVFVKYLKE